MSTATAETTAAPSPEGQDGLGAIQPANPAPSTADRLATARQAHGAAIENHRQASARADRAGSLHRQAIADRQALLDRASAGQPVDPIDITRAGTSVAEAKDAFDLAAVIASGAGKRADHCHIAALAAEASHLRAVYDRRLQERIAAAAEVDTQWSALQSAIGHFNDTTLNVRIADSGIRMHNEGLKAHAASNKVLACLEPGHHPKAQPPAAVVMKPAKAAFVVVGQIDLMEDKFASLEGRERSLFGVVEKPAIPAPRDESWLERQARERAFADAHTGKAPTWAPTRIGT
jgi:hypothetical protein